MIRHYIRNVSPRPSPIFSTDSESGSFFFHRIRQKCCESAESEATSLLINWTKSFSTKVIFGLKCPKTHIMVQKIEKWKKKSKTFRKKNWNRFEIIQNVFQYENVDFEIFFQLRTFQGPSDFFGISSWQINPSSKHMCPEFGLAPRFFRKGGEFFRFYLGKSTKIGWET